MAERNKVFVGNLAFNAEEGDLRDMFKECGEVEDAVIIYDRETGRSRGFGFVTYSSEKEAQDAIGSLNGAELKGRDVAVREADNKGGRGGGGGGGRGRGGYNRGGGYQSRGDYQEQRGGYQSRGYGGGDNYRSGGGRDRDY